LLIIHTHFSGKKCRLPLKLTELLRLCHSFANSTG